MPIIKLLKGLAFFASSSFIFTQIASAQIQYNVGLAFGIGHFEFNGTDEKATFVGSLGTETMRTTYKYVDNHPQKNIHIEAGLHKSFTDINALDRNLFLGANFTVGMGKTNNTPGLTNPAKKYMNTGSTAMFYAINAKFGLENEFSKLYGLLGLTYAKADLPFDVLPNLPQTGAANNIMTCTSYPALTITGSPFAAAEPLLANACNNVKVHDASYGAFFFNLGAGAEFKLAERLNFFLEYIYLLQFNKNKEYTVNYSKGDQNGVFKGKIITTNTQFIKFGARYYF